MTEREDVGDLPWGERVVMLSINPDAASRGDVARLAADLMEAKRELEGVRKALEKLHDGYETLFFQSAVLAEILAQKGGKEKEAADKFCEMIAKVSQECGANSIALGKKALAGWRIRSGHV